MRKNNDTISAVFKERKAFMAVYLHISLGLDVRSYVSTYKKKPCPRTDKAFLHIRDGAVLPSLGFYSDTSLISATGAFFLTDSMPFTQASLLL
jgi:hypothetical protein